MSAAPPPAEGRSAPRLAAPVVPAAPPCANCAAPVPDRFCGRCGQERRSLRLPVHQLAAEAAGELLSADSRLARTLPPLLLRPGAVTRDYLDGRRARYTSPVKLYLLTSFLFFLAQALGPAEGHVRVVGAEAEGGAAQASLEGLEELRGGGPWGARIAGRLEGLARLPPGEARRRISTVSAENVPRAMFFLLPVMALLLSLLHRRPRVYLAEHVVFALHAHVVAFALMLPGAALGSSRAQAAGFAAALVHLFLAMRRVYGRSWPGTAVRAAALVLLYLNALTVALVAVVLAAVLVV